jgi:hypothetical protein
MTGQHQLFIEKNCKLENMKLLVYSQESLDTMEEWFQGFMSPAEQPPAISSPTTSPTSCTSQVQAKYIIDYSEVPVEFGTDMQLILKDDAEVKCSGSTGPILNQSMNQGAKDQTGADSTSGMIHG